MSIRAFLQRHRLALLLAVVGALVWLNLNAPDPMPVGGAVPQGWAAGSRVSQPELARPVDFTSKTAVVLPRQIGRPSLEVARRDPFAPEVMQPIAIAKAPHPKPTPVIEIPPPTPEPPPLNLNYAGRMHAPDGSLVVYASQGETSFALAPGLVLPNGYRVESITERVVEFSFTAMNRTARLDLPAPQTYETR